MLKTKTFIKNSKNLRKLTNVNFHPSLYTHNFDYMDIRTGEVLTTETFTNILEAMAYNTFWFGFDQIKIPRRFLYIYKVI